MEPEVIGNATLYLGDCLEILPTLGKVDAVVTDPPYGLKFMGKGWDHGVPGVPYWSAILDACKPGAHLLAFGGTRTYHRLVCAIEDAGWEIRDTIMWVYGSGFPKSLDASKAIDKAAGATPVDLGPSPNWRESKRNREQYGSMEVRGDNAGRLTKPATDEAKHWQGWGTALKPALEPICLARKPFKGTVAGNVLEHGTGALNIDGARVPGEPWTFGTQTDITGGGYNSKRPSNGDVFRRNVQGGQNGRWPANLIHDGSEEVVGLFPHTSSGKMAPTHTEAARSVYGQNAEGGYTTMETYGDAGSAARFFYCAKASRSERDEGLVGDDRPLLWSSGTQNPGSFQSENTKRAAKNNHPTVKPLALMRYLCGLITPPGGVVVDPFMGSGSTGRAALEEGFRFIGVELEEPYFEIARQRISITQAQGKLAL